MFFLNPDGSVKSVLFNSGVKKEEQEARLPKVLEVINNNYQYNPQEDAVQESEAGQVPVQPEAAGLGIQVVGAEVIKAQIRVPLLAVIKMMVVGRRR